MGKGRCMYLASWSRDYAFYRLMRRAIFWAAHAEERFSALDLTSADDLFAYAYPSAGMIAVLNAGTEKANATLRCDPTILKIGADSKLRLEDIVTGKNMFAGTGAALAGGARMDLLPNCVVLLRIVRE
jgi:hypothetical protein